MVVLHLILAERSNEQSDFLHRVAADEHLEALVPYKCVAVPM